MVSPPDPAALVKERAWLAVNDAKPRAGRWLGYLSKGGPGYLQSALTLGGGSASASLVAGAVFGYQLLWVAPMGMLIGMIMMMAIAHQTLSTGMRPFEAMRVHAGAFFAYGWAIGGHLAFLAVRAGLLARARDLDPGWQRNRPRMGRRIGLDLGGGERATFCFRLKRNEVV